MYVNIQMEFKGMGDLGGGGADADRFSDTSWGVGVAAANGLLAIRRLMPTDLAIRREGVWATDGNGFGDPGPN